MSDKIKTLAQAIRVGCLSSTPCIGEYVQFMADGSVEACALGAAALALGFDQTSDGLPTTTVRDRFPSTCATGRFYLCPSCGQAKCSLNGVITHLNDAHIWSREAIADYAEEMEKDQP